VELFSDETEKPRGCGIIEFENAASAKKAIEKMHRFELGGRKIVVKEVNVHGKDTFAVSIFLLRLITKDLTYL